MKKFSTLQSLNLAVVEARRAAHEEARRDFPCAFSRGTFLSTTDTLRREQCDPHPQAECPVWHGSLREIEELVVLVEAEYPNVGAIWIGGGFDGAESPLAYRESDYCPWASSWDVLVWEREAARADDEQAHLRAETA